MTDDGKSGGNSSAASRLHSAEILREAAKSASSLREMWTILSARPWEEVRTLALDLADLMEAGAASENPHPPPASAAVSASGSCPGTEASAAAAAASESAAKTHPKAADGAAAPLPKIRKLLLFSDGAARGNPGHAGAGAVLKLPDGRIVARLGKYLGSQTNNVAEYTALILGLTAALKLGATEVEATADSQLMVYQLNGRYQVKDARLKGLFDQARALFGKFERWSIRHVLRSYNKDADEMSNRAIDERMDGRLEIPRQ